MEIDSKEETKLFIAVHQEQHQEVEQVQVEVQVEEDNGTRE